MNFIDLQYIFRQKQHQMKRLLTQIGFAASKMANFVSQARHSPTVGNWTYGDGKTPQKIRIAMWNTNGIRSVLQKGKLQQFLFKYDPDILAINETKIDLKAYIKMDKLFNFSHKTNGQNNDKDSELKQWHQYWNFCKVSAGYSGVAYFSKYKPIQAIEDFECSYLALEGRCLTLQFQKFYLVNCYKPNSGSELERLDQRVSQYDKKFSQFVQNLRNKNNQEKHVIIVGDLNVAHQSIDLKNPKSNTKNAGFTIQERYSFNCLLNKGFLDTFRYLNPNKIQYTWWSNRNNARKNNIGWRIDYILVSSYLRSQRNVQIQFSPKELLNFQMIPEQTSRSEQSKQGKSEIEILEANIYDEFQGSDHCPIDALLKII